MEVDIAGVVGPVQVADGVGRKFRQSRTGEQVVSQVHGRWYEQASRGALFTVSTAVAGVAPGTALSTTPPMALWNPSGSGVNLAIDQVYLGFVSGTLGAGSLVHAYVGAGSQPAAPTGGTELVPTLMPASPTGGKVRAFQGSTVATTPVLIRPGIIIGTTPTTPVAAPAVDPVDGAIVIPPGGVYVVQGVTAAGSTPLVMIGVAYEEIPV